MVILLDNLRRVVAKKIGEFRKTKGFTQHDLAVEIEKPVGTLKNWEQGINEPSFVDLERIAAILGRKPHEFFTDEELPVSGITESQRKQMLISFLAQFDLLRSLGLLEEVEQDLKKAFLLKHAK